MTQYRIASQLLILVILSLVTGTSHADSIEQSVEVAWSLDDTPATLHFDAFDTLNGQLELVAVELGFEGVVDLEVLIQNFSASEWEADDWYYDAGANVMVAFEPKTGNEDGGPFFGLGGVFINEITGLLSAGSGGTPFDSPTPGDIAVTADERQVIDSTVRTESGLNYFVSDQPLAARTEPFLDFILTPPLEEPNAFIQGTAINLVQEGEITLVYEFVQRLGRPEDCNADGVVDALDLECVCSGGSSVEDVLHAIGGVTGDLDSDGKVAFPDFLALSDNYGKPGTYLEGDLDCDGNIDFADFLLLADNFGESSDAALASVPEPTTTALLLAGLVCLLVQKDFGPSRK